MVNFDEFLTQNQVFLKVAYQLISLSVPSTHPIFLPHIQCLPHKPLQLQAISLRDPDFQSSPVGFGLSEPSMTVLHIQKCSCRIQMRLVIIWRENREKWRFSFFYMDFFWKKLQFFRFFAFLKIFFEKSENVKTSKNQFSTILWKNRAWKNWFSLKKWEKLEKSREISVFLIFFDIKKKIFKQLENVKIRNYQFLTNL